MKVFITGISGLLGSTMARFLINQGHEVVGIDNMIGGVDGNVPALATYISGDVLDVELLKAKGKVWGCNALFREHIVDGLIAVDPMTLGYLQDINIDWVEEGLNEYIKIQSPLEVAQCGCGESFTI